MPRLAFALALFTIGCASTANDPSRPAAERVLAVDENGDILRSPSSESEAVVTLAVATDAAFRAVVAAYGALEIPMTIANGATGQVGNATWAMPKRFLNWSASRYFDCGTNMTGQIAEQGRMSVRVVTQVRAAAGTDRTKSAVSTLATGSVLAPGGDHVRCSSTGVLERQIQSQVTAKAAR